jgi:hypothetical protein
MTPRTPPGFAGEGFRGTRRFPAPFFRSRLRDVVDATAATIPQEKQRGNLPVSPYAASPAHRQQVGP